MQFNRLAIHLGLDNYRVNIMNWIKLGLLAVIIAWRLFDSLTLKSSYIRSRLLVQENLSGKAVALLHLLKSYLWSVGVRIVDKLSFLSSNLLSS